MSIPHIDPQELRDDEQFMQNLARLEKEAQEEQSVAKSYQLLDAYLLIEQESKDIDSLFGFILEVAFEKLSVALTEQKSFDVVINEEERAVARALYERAMDLYSSKQTLEAKELFLILYYIVDFEELKEAFMVHALCVMASMEFEQFVDEIIDQEAIDPYDPLAFFATKFTSSFKQLSKRYESEYKEALRELDEFDASKEEL